MRTVFIAALLLSSGALAQELPVPPKPADEMDMSKREKLLNTTGLVTRKIVDDLGVEADAALSKGDCETALQYLPEYALKTNALANLTRAGLEPFYSASYDRKKRFSPPQELIDKETFANSLLERRNKAWIDEADCLVKKGDLQTAAVRYSHALDIISLDERDTWKRARDGLWKIIGVDGQP